MALTNKPNVAGAAARTGGWGSFDNEFEAEQKTAGGADGSSGQAKHMEGAAAGRMHMAGEGAHRDHGQAQALGPGQQHVGSGPSPLHHVPAVGGGTAAYGPAMPGGAAPGGELCDVDVSNVWGVGGPWATARGGGMEGGQGQVMEAAGGGDPLAHGSVPSGRCVMKCHVAHAK